ncbi:MAG: lycopene beta-cyclase CrtY [Proteobacteria bacterium]|nr:lycopene beta-cyclase CrtY [Pseudomonadota bacterium]
MNAAQTRADVVLAGGGLANSLIAMRLKALRPGLRVVMLEREATIGGQHTWCHFATDVSPAIGDWLRPLFVAEWAGYDIRFPAHRRSLTTAYRAISSERLHQVVAPLMDEDAWLGVDIAEVTPDAVRLKDGRALSAPLVIDGRGPRRSPDLALGWQKFIGREVRLAAPHGLTRPIVMDATVPQLDGYRFLYVLPLGPDRLLIEDTRYSDGPALDRAAIGREIDAYAAQNGWTVAEVEREEEGVLPIALAGHIDAYWAAATPGVPEVGLRSALFQPTTGYSLPDAARMAEAVAAAPDLTSAAIRKMTEAVSKAAWTRRGYYRLLNRMMFRACEPNQRYRVLERFYRLPQPLVERFYAGDATMGDKIRILTGKPPVPVSRAMRCLTEQSAFAPGASA